MAAHVNHWISFLPPHLFPSASRKRSHCDENAYLQAQTQPQKRLRSTPQRVSARIALAKMSTNSKARSGPKKRASQTDMDLDESVTKKAKPGYSKDTDPSLDSASMPPPARRSARDTPSTLAPPTTQSKTIGTRKGRPAVKKMPYALDPIEVYVVIPDKETAKLPEEAAAFLSDIRAIGNGKKILRRESKPKMMAIYEEHCLPSLSNDSFYGSDVELDLSDDLEPVKKLVGYTTDCGTNSSDEWTWNLSVHSVLLRMAVEKWKGNKSIRCDPALSADVHPAYQPRDEDGKPYNKRIDFAISLKLSRQLLEQYQSLSDMINPSVNCTDYRPLDKNPLASLVETKISGDHLKEGLSQLGVFAFGQNKKLMGELNNRPAFVPHFVVQGETWHAVVTWVEKFSGKERLIVVREPMPIGSSTDVGGIARIIKALHRAFTWAEEVHLPFLEEAIAHAIEQRGPIEETDSGVPMTENDD